MMSIFEHLRKFVTVQSIRRGCCGQHFFPFCSEIFRIIVAYILSDNLKQNFIRYIFNRKTLKYCQPNISVYYSLSKTNFSKKNQTKLGIAENLWGDLYYFGFSKTTLLNEFLLK